MQNTNYLQFNMAANSPQEDREDSHSKRAHSPPQLDGEEHRRHGHACPHCLFAAWPLHIDM